ncbi:MAG: DegT/DnrJ/EryC1/StrS family aminotransferase [Candidatus Omnitrophica bacterium]|nr:DegT/DnrJ/EryC1/StrS family aminotransferase [Candidatus Omnitrophota bacterium]MBU4303663.1 DegT/DnrJ/EryC1/StrS family aminotransferase [Candidatus Omnitrophota bacterium]MBU4467979.1 DegT/DnrJ/EryC1/StrS family aminotransferase [Candidatus Omnitrophota bacterium]
MQTRRQGNGVLLSFKTRSGYEFFKEFFKTGALNKTLWEDMEYWDLSLVNSLIKGFWRGDGSKDFQGLSVCSIDLDLIEKIRIILIRNHILPCYGIRTVDKHKSSIVKGKTIEAKHNLYSLACYGINGEKFANIVDEKYISRTKRQQAFFKILNNVKYIAYPIHRISYKSYRSKMVYNLEVRGLHSFHAGRVVAHNCYCDSGKDGTCGKRFSQKFGDLPYGYDHKYIYSHIGYNLKATDMQAAIGVAQLKKLPRFIAARKKNFAFFMKHFKKYEKYLILPEAAKKSDPSWFGFPILVKASAPFSRNDIVSYLEQNKIATRMLFGGNLTKQPAYKNVKYRIYGSLNNTDMVMNSLFWIGVYPGLNYSMLTYTKNTVKGFFRKI